MPKPEKHVFVCSQGRPPGHPRGSCSEKGAAGLMETFLNELQTRGLFEKVAVTNTGCMGPCQFGGTVLVYPDGIMYGGVTVPDVKEIFDAHLVGGEPVERLRMPAEVWS